MAIQPFKSFFQDIYHAEKLLKRQEFYKKFVYGMLNRCHSQFPNGEKVEGDVLKDAPKDSSRSEVEKTANYESGLSKYSSGDKELRDSKWRLDLDWVSKALEPALQLCRWAVTTGNGVGNRSPPSSRSLAEIIASIQRSKTGIEGWSLSDLTIGLFLIYLRQASLNPFEDVKGVQIFSDTIVHDLIYHIELAKGCYKNDASALARNTMLRENNILKFVKYSSVMRPGYYIGIDHRKKFVILGIRGTHTAYDLITDIVSSSDGGVTFEGYSTHFGTAEAARWFLTHEIGTLKKYLEKYKGFRLRLVGHSLGGATASLLAIMLRQKSSKELGFSPDIVTAVGYATPPCVSRELAENCSDFVTTVVMQDDIVPRLSAASLARLRSEILQTDWMSVVEKEDWRSVIDLVTNAKQVVSSIQVVARKLADYAKFRNNNTSSDGPLKKELTAVPVVPLTSKEDNNVMVLKDGAAGVVPEELFVPGTVYYLKRNLDTTSSNTNGRAIEFFTLWKRQPGEHFQRIVLSSNIISDHKCDSHYHALRDVLKGFPGSNDEAIFR